MTARGYFVAGTDTGVGKTLVTCSLLERARTEGLRAVGLKPIAAGCVETPEGRRNDDALALMAHSGVTLAYAQVNPFALRDPLSPHIAAAREHVTIDLDVVAQAYAQAAQLADLVLVEGAGGWMAPLSDRLSMADLAQRLALPVILVVGVRLGCLNHAMLTARAIAADGCVLAGWIGSVIEPTMVGVAENLATLNARLPAPCLGVLSRHDRPQPNALSRHVELPHCIARS